MCVCLIVEGACFTNTCFCPTQGLLRNVVGAVRRGEVPDAALLPVAVDYERVPVVEQATYASSLLGQ